MKEAAKDPLQAEDVAPVSEIEAAPCEVALLAQAWDPSTPAEVEAVAANSEAAADPLLVMACTCKHTSSQRTPTCHSCTMLHTITAKRHSLAPQQIHKTNRCSHLSPHSVQLLSPTPSCSNLTSLATGSTEPTNWVAYPDLDSTKNDLLYAPCV